MNCVSGFQCCIIEMDAQTGDRYNDAWDRMEPRADLCALIFVGKSANLFQNKDC